jgi:Cu+-exporting ATPase
MLTGESVPVTVEPASQVTGATVNTSGRLVVRATAVGADTALAQMVRLVEEAQEGKAEVQRLADRIAAWFVPAVVVIAVVTFVTWALLGPAPALAYAVVNAVAVLIIACPCALGLATPMSIMVGVGRGAGAGILIRNAEALEAMEKVNTLVVDKTGTLTEGKPKLVSLVTAPGAGDERAMLALAGGLERGSEHPLAAAIIAGAKERGVGARGRRELRVAHRPEDHGHVRGPPGRAGKPKADGRIARGCRVDRRAGGKPPSRGADGYVPRR